MISSKEALVGDLKLLCGVRREVMTKIKEALSVISREQQVQEAVCGHV